MRDKLQRFKAITKFVNGLEIGEVEKKAIFRILKRLEHGLRTKDNKSVVRAINELSGFFVKVVSA